MKKWIVWIALGVAVISAASVGPAYAQDETPAGSPWGDTVLGAGILHDYMVEAFADALGVTVDELDARLAAGETLAAIAADLGISAEEFPALWLEARSVALEAAVADGVLTAEQASWMEARMLAGGRRLNGTGAGAPGARQQSGGNANRAGLNSCPHIQP
jgi:hypothetical protein